MDLAARKHVPSAFVPQCYASTFIVDQQCKAVAVLRAPNELEVLNAIGIYTWQWCLLSAYFVHVQAPGELEVPNGEADGPDSPISNGSGHLQVSAYSTISSTGH